MSVASEQPCRECGALMAAEQRYCLECGSRRGEPRLDFRDHLGVRGDEAGRTGAANGRAATAADASPEGRRPQRDYTPLAAAGGIAVLGLMLLVGVLIGRGNGEGAVAPPPQVVRVQGDGGEATTAGEANGPGAATEKTATKGGKGGGAAKDAAKAPPPEVTATESDLEELQEKSPQEYSEASAELPDEIATPGAPPPTDGKKPGGGSSGTAIE